MRRRYLGPGRPDRIIGPSKSNGHAAATYGGRHRGCAVADRHVDIVGRDQIGEEKLNENPDRENRNERFVNNHGDNLNLDTSNVW